jgi:hypothetical protein
MPASASDAGDGLGEPCSHKAISFVQRDSLSSVGKVLRSGWTITGCAVRYSLDNLDNCEAQEMPISYNIFQKYLSV